MEIKEFDKMAEFEKDYWWWVGKRNIVKGILSRLNLSFANILDAGCGTGFNLGYLQDYGNIIGLDFSKDALNFCKKSEHKYLVQADAETLPFKDETFDILTALDCLEHLDDTKCIREFKRILKPDGYLIATVPAFMFLWSAHDEALHHKRRYNKNQLKDLLKLNGFKIIKISYWNFFLFLPIAAVRIIKKSVANRDKKIETDVEEIPDMVNKLLAYLLRVESFLLLHANLPVGVSLICVGKPKK